MPIFENSIIEGAKTKEVDDGPEFRPGKAEKLLRLMNVAKNIESLQGNKAEDVLADEEERRQFVLNLSPDQYLEILTGVNGILRNKDKEEWAADGEKVAMMGSHGVVWDFPEHEDKKELLGQSLLAAKQMIQEGRSMEDVALLLSVTVGATHLFNDGNGRLSRFVLLVVNNGYSKEKNSLYQKILSSHEFSNSTNGGLLQGEIIDAMEREIGMKKIEDGEVVEIDFVDTFGRIPFEKIQKGDFIFSEKATTEKKNIFLKKLNESWVNMFQAMFVHCEKSLEEYKDESGNVLLDNVISSLDDEDINQIFAIWRQQKKKHVEMLIDCIANPDKKEYQFSRPKRDGTPRILSALELYKARIKRFTGNELYEEVFGAK